MKKGVLYWILGSVIFVLVLSNILLFFYLPSLNHSTMDMEEKRDHFVSLKNNMQLELVEDRDVEGVHPCGECIGEILEGHGNPNLAKYFANAIAEKVGEEHIQTLKEIIEKKYGAPLDEQYDY